METDPIRDTSHEQVVPYDPEWPARYEAEAAEIRGVIGDSLLGLEHIGSTSIPGLAAKPIVDIMALVASSDVAESLIPALAELGYPFNDGRHSKDNSTERHLARKGSPTQFHLSLAYADKGSFWKRQLAFRDYLREHPEDRDRYAALKQALIEQDPTGKNGYIGGKTDLVNEILDKSGFVRWKPPAA
jgi:GrpB-like predicted nucleotidyltransferase (UPF0157 family)